MFFFVTFLSFSYGLRLACRSSFTEVKAILIGPGGENPDPFLEIQLGRETNIQMRNMVSRHLKLQKMVIDVAIFFRAENMVMTTFKTIRFYINGFKWI